MHCDSEIPENARKTCLDTSKTKQEATNGSTC